MGRHCGMIWVEILGTEHEATGWGVLGELWRLQDTLLRLRRMIAGTCFSFFECPGSISGNLWELVHGDVERGRRLLADAVARPANAAFSTRRWQVFDRPGVLFAEALRSGIEPGLYPGYHSHSAHQAAGRRTRDLALAGQDSDARTL